MLMSEINTLTMLIHATKANLLHFNNINYDCLLHRPSSLSDT